MRLRIRTESVTALEIKDLQDPRDREHCLRAQRQPRVQGAADTNVVWRRPEMDEKIYNYDENNEQEFQAMNKGTIAEIRREPWLAKKRT